MNQSMKWMGRMMLRAAGTAVAAGVVLMGNTQADAVTATMSLSQKSVSASQAVFDIFLTFPGAAGDQIEAIQLNIEASTLDPSRFSFVPDTTTLPDWFELSSLDPGPGFYIPLDPVLGPFLLASAGPQDLGDLIVDLAGLAPDTLFTVSLLGGSFGSETDLGGTIDGQLVFSFNDVPGTTVDPAELVFDQGSVEFRTLAAPSSEIPEPITATLGLLGAAALGGATLRRRR